MIQFRMILSVFCLALLLGVTGGAEEGEKNPFSAFHFRAIGPAGMSGRISSIDAVRDNPDIIYVGSATGGIWKSVNGGITWKPVFDRYPVSSIGDVKVFQKNPSIVWAGTGEGNVRNSAGVGRGMYKSIDGGRTWRCVGLEETERIVRIALHPDDPNVVYAAALGKLWGENPQRGVYQTTDGGKTWKKVLYDGPRTGACDLVMAPDNPNHLIAALWEHYRKPWFFHSGGPGSALYMTVDGGVTWKKLNDQLPAGDLGRIGLAFAQNRPQVVYALVEAQKSALFRSEDGGYTWNKVNDKPGIHGRPFYYSRIQVNPVNENILYTLQTWFRVSEDGGRNFEPVTRGFRQLHSDFHALWIAPDGERMIIGNDGGVGISNDRGTAWRFVRNLPLGQFYHISVDDQVPYRVYGGLQDNGSWVGINTALDDQGVMNHHWKMVGFGDGFGTEPDRTNPGYGYGMSQGGSLYYFDVRTGVSRWGIVPPEGETQNRYNWNAGMAVDPLDPKTVYFGSQFLFKTTDRGLNWQRISPDLSRNDPDKQPGNETGGLTRDVSGAENYATIITIAPSPVKKGVIWVGTDDGNLYLTRDEGTNWTRVGDHLIDGRGGHPPAGTWIPCVEASPFDAARAYVVFDDHRRSNWQTYIFTTDDYGRSWKSISTPQIDGFAHVIREDPFARGHLYLGTEFGLYYSYDRGKRWHRMTGGFPTVPVRDIAVQKRERDLVVGTHGRGIYILDDITALSEMEDSVLERPFHLFGTADTCQYLRAWSPSFVSPSDADFFGENEPEGARITYYVGDLEPDAGKEKTGPPAGKIEILNDQDAVIRTLKPVFKPGFNILYWDLRDRAIQTPYTRKPLPRDHDAPGWEVRPGKYSVRITCRDVEYRRSFAVKMDPRFLDQRQVMEENYRKLEELKNRLTLLTTGLEEIRKSIGAIDTFLQVADSDGIREIADPLKDQLEKLQNRIINPDPQIQGFIDQPPSLTEDIYRSYPQFIFPWTQYTRNRYQRTMTRLADFIADYNDLMEKDLGRFRERLKKTLKDRLESGELLRIFADIQPLKLK